MLYFEKNNQKIMLQLKRVSGGTLSFAAGPWGSPVEGSGGKALSHFTPG